MSAPPVSKAAAARPEQRTPAEHAPVARICVDIPIPHLDRPFDYLVPATLDEVVVPGSRVRVRFAGQLVDGFVLDRVQRSDHTGRLAYVAKSVSAEPVLSPEIAVLARTVADRWAGSMTDVLRLAIPPRHAGAEKRSRPQPADPPALPPDPGGWARYPSGPAFLRELAAGGRPRAVWTAAPGEDWAARIAEAALTAYAAGRGALIVVPDHRDVDALDAVLSAVADGRAHVVLTAALAPAERYGRWLAVRRGDVRIVLGTRAAAFAPVRALGLVVILDDGDDLHAEPHAPYPNARDVLMLRAHQSTAGMLFAGYARSAEAQLAVRSRWAADLAAPQPQVRAAAPRVMAAGDDFEVTRDEAARSARLPSLAWRTAKAALQAGRSVLVQVPRRGWTPALGCAACRAPARCARCGGPLATGGDHAVPSCRWCGALAADWRCPHCDTSRLRAVVVGASRTADELGRAFPATTVRRSAGDTVLSQVPDDPAIVVATPGAEPGAPRGYGAALLLDGWAMLSRPDLRAGEETLRRWINAARLVRPGSDGGTVVVMADPGLPAVQALVRWAPASFADRELTERAELGFPPAVRMASLTGTPDAVVDLVATAALPPTADQLGPVPVGDPGADPGQESERLLIRVPRADGAALAAALHEAAGVRSARKAGDLVRIRLDPAEVG